MINAKTRKQAAADFLREAIIDGVFKFGDRLKQERLAEQLGCSAIPIREALQQLAMEGFVVLDPQRGARIREFDSRELEEIYEVRIALESLAVRRAAKRITPVAAERIRSILGKMEAPGIPANKRLALNWKFHEMLYACSEQRFLCNLIVQLRRNVEPYLRLDIVKVANYAAGGRDHYRILDACVRQDAEAAARYVAAHIRRTAKPLIDYVRRHWK